MKGGTTRAPETGKGRPKRSWATGRSNVSQEATNNRKWGEGSGAVSRRGGACMLAADHAHSAKKVPGPRGGIADSGRSRRDRTATLQRASPRLLQPAALHSPG